MDRNELFKRTEAILKPQIARGERWVIVGLGSGGARVAEEASRFGVGQLVLIDRPGERLREHNVIRHVLGYRDLGRLKTEAMREHIRNIHPGCRVETLSMDVTRGGRRLREVIASATQVHLCTDNEGSRHAVNEQAVQAGVPLLFAGVFDGGCGGEVGRVRAGGACYACIAACLNRSSGPGGREEAESLDYAHPRSAERSTAALNLDIAQIALIQARAGLLTMLGRHERASDFDGNYILFGNRPVEGLFPRMLCSDIWTIPADPGCIVCGMDTPGQARTDALAAEIRARALCRQERDCRR